MSSDFERAIAITNDLRAAIEEARTFLAEIHGATKDMKQARRELHEALAKVPDKMDQMVDEKLADVVNKQLGTIETLVKDTHRHILSEFDKLVGPLYDALSLTALAALLVDKEKREPSVTVLDITELLRHLDG